MRYKQRRRLYSQNNLCNPKLVKKLIRHSSIGKKDTTLEIGAGRGIITQELVKSAGRVIAVELDEKLYLHLKEKFKGANNLELVCGDFLNFKLPNFPYKVFANIPFIITADVIKRLTSDNNLTEAYLIIQKESAEKFIGMPLDCRNQMMAILLKPWFEIIVFWEFKRSDFIPRPNVDCVMVKIKRLEVPLIPLSQKEIFRNFVLYKYNRSKISKMEYVYLIKLFEEYVKDASPRQKRIVEQEAKRILNREKSLKKIRRTRKDKRWKRFK